MWKDRHLYDQSAAGYDAFIRQFVPSYDAMQQRVIETLVEFCGKNGPTDVLELGVGTGALAFRLLSDLPVRQYWGFETSAELARLARERLSMFAADTTVTNRDFQETQWPTDVAAIISTLTFHYLSNEDKEHVLRQCFQTLAPRGILVVGDRVISRSPKFTEIYRLRMTRFWDRATAHWTPDLRAAHQTQDDPNEEPWFLEDQLQLLRTIGFAEVECVWKDFNYCVFCGVRPEREKSE